VIVLETDTMDENRITIATDGSCLGNPGPGGWAWADSDGNHDSGAHPDTTNNLMELRALFEALKSRPSETPLRLQVDSMYVINIFTNWLESWKSNEWKTAGNKPVQNRQGIELINAELAHRDVIWEHIKGHSGHPLNERVDKLARDAALRQQRKVAPTS